MRDEYQILLRKYQPKVIKTEAEYEATLNKIEPLIFNKNKTPAQEDIYNLLAVLIKDYESSQFSLTQSAPHEVLQFLMEQKGIRQADLVGLIGSKGVVSEMVNGKRPISKRAALALGRYFCVSPDLFI